MRSADDPVRRTPGWDTARSLRRYRNGLINEVIADHIIHRRHVLDVLGILSKSQKTALIQFQDHKGKPIHRLSGGVHDGQVTTFEDSQALLEFRRSIDLDNKQAFRQLGCSEVRVYVSTDAKPSLAKALLDVSKLIYERSLYAQNLRTDQNKSLTGQILESKRQLFDEQVTPSDKLSSFCALINSTSFFSYMAGFVILNYSHKVIREQFLDDIQIKGNNLEFRLACSASLHSSNVTVYEADGGPYLLFPLSSSTYHHVIPHAVFVAKSKRSLTRTDVREIDRLLHDFIHMVFVDAQDEISARLKIFLKSSRLSECVGWARISEFLADVGNFMAPSVLHLTGSHSFVLRRYSPARRTLIPVVQHHAPEGQRSPGVLNAEIPIAKWRTSCNAFAFMACTRREAFIYLSDMKRPPEAYRKRGMSGIQEWREHSRSEITLPLFFRDSPLGVLNLESPSLDNYTSHKFFLAEMAEAISSAMEGMVTSSDVSWIADTAQSRAAAHEIRQVLWAERTCIPSDRPLQVGNRDALEQIWQLIERRLVEQGNDNTIELSYYLREFIRANQLGDRAQRIFLMLERMPPLRANADRCVLDISREMVRNFANSSDPRNEVVFRFLESSSSHRRAGTLYIEAQICDFVGENLVDGLSLRPVFTDGRAHLGMFFVGALARSSGGWCDVELDKRLGSKHITVRIPIRT